MFTLSIDDLVYLHNQIIEATGGLAGVKDENILQAAIARPHQSAFRNDAYENPYNKAAALLDSIANNHGFNDGNKRTAMAAAALFLFRNDIQIDFTNDEYEIFMLYVVNKKPSVKNIGSWLKKHSTSIN